MYKKSCVLCFSLDLNWIKNCYLPGEGEAVLMSWQDVHRSWISWEETQEIIFSAVLPPVFPSIFLCLLFDFFSIPVFASIFITSRRYPNRKWVRGKCTLLLDKWVLRIRTCLLLDCVSLVLTTFPRSKSPLWIRCSGNEAFLLFTQSVKFWVYVELHHWECCLRAKFWTTPSVFLMVLPPSWTFPPILL